MRLIAIDLDGTLLNHRKEISKENIKAIKYAQSLGIEVIISTGRAYFDALSICKKAQISTYIISYTGASIHSKKGEQISSIPMNKKDVEEAIKYFKEYNFYYEIATSNGIYTHLNSREKLQAETDMIKKANPELDATVLQDTMEIQFNQSGFVFFENYKEVLKKDEDFFSMLAFSFDNFKIKTGRKHFERMKHLSLFSSGSHNFELVNSLASKGNALEKLSALLDISLDQSMAIGDSHNDISMLERVNYSVAMGNANDDIKSLCKFITHSNDDNGVAHAIYKFISSQTIEDYDLSDISLA